MIKVKLSEKNFRKQRQFCVNLLRKIKKANLKNIHECLLHNRKFGLVSHEAIIKPPKNNQTITVDLAIAELFNVAFANILCEN